MMDLLTSAMDAGAALAETFSKPVNTGASFTRYGTVVKNNGTTLDVELCGATLAAVPMLTTCAGAKAGDRCLLTVDGPLVTVTGILANADNTHYVNYGPVYPNLSLPESWYEVRNGIVIVHAASYDQVTAGSGNNGTLLWTMPEWLRPRRTVVAGGTRLADGVAQLSILNSGDVKVFGFMSNVTYWGVTACYAVTP